MHVLEADPELAPRATLLLPDGVHELALLRGRALDADERAAVAAGLTVYCDDEEPALPEWFFAGVAPVVSSRVLGALAALGVDNVEAFRVTVEGDDGPVASDHHCLNVVGRVSCIDLARSTSSAWAGRLFKLETMRLHAKAPDDLTLFRPAEWALVVLARDELAEGLAAQRIVGLRITPADAWRNEDF